MCACNVFSQVLYNIFSCNRFKSIVYLAQSSVYVLEVLGNVWTEDVLKSVNKKNKTFKTNIWDIL